MILQDLQPTGTLTDHIISHSIIIIWLLSQYIPSFLDRANQSSMVDMPFYPKFYDHNLTYNIPIYPNISLSIYIYTYIYIHIYIHTWLVDTRLPNWVPGVQVTGPPCCRKALLNSRPELGHRAVPAEAQVLRAGATWSPRRWGWDVARVAIVMGVPH